MVPTVSTTGPPAGRFNRCTVAARSRTGIVNSLTKSTGTVGKMAADLNNPYPWPLASESLALAWLAQGEPSRAARVLDEAAAQPLVTTIPNMAFAWLTVELRRAQVYRQLGRVEEAEQIEAGLRKLLAHADPDHVILRELKRLS